MKMKNILLAIIAITLISCETITKDKRTTTLNADSFVKPVVVIDFTGVGCMNCPKAAEMIRDMHKIAGDKIIGVAMYPDCSFNHTEFDLRVPEATKYYEHFGDISKIVLPSGMVDFVPYNGLKILDIDAFGSAVIQRITTAAPIDIEIKCTRKMPNDKILDITAKINSKTDASNNYSMVLWIIEDNIKGTQNYYGKMIDDYIHNHVLRTAINGLWGEEISLSATTPYEKTLSYEVKNDKWDLKNCSVIALIINTQTKEIVTAAKTKINQLII